MAISKALLSPSVMSDDFWQQIEPLLPLPLRKADSDYLRKPGAGRKPKSPRLVFEAILYVLRSGCQWKALPKKPYGSASAVHQRYLEWLNAGVFDAIWARGLAASHDMAGIAWRWQGNTAKECANVDSKSLKDTVCGTTAIWHPARDHRIRKSTESVSIVSKK